MDDLKDKIGNVDWKLKRLYEIVKILHPTEMNKISAATLLKTQNKDNLDPDSKKIVEELISSGDLDKYTINIGGRKRNRKKRTKRKRRTRAKSRRKSGRRKRRKSGRR